MKYLSFNQRFKIVKKWEMYIKNAPTLYELRHSKYSCKNNKFNKSKLSLIGTVQQILYESRTNAQWQNVSISHRYGPTGEPLKSMALGGRFQSLIDTVQQNSRWREKKQDFLSFNPS